MITVSTDGSCLRNPGGAIGWAWANHDGTSDSGGAPSGTNQIAVEVYRFSDGDWLEDQDMIRLSGIFRSVHLYSTPAVHLRDFKLDTPLGDDYTAAELAVTASVRAYDGRGEGSYSVETQLYDDAGHPVWPRPPQQPVDPPPRQRRAAVQRADDGADDRGDRVVVAGVVDGADDRLLGVVRVAREDVERARHRLEQERARVPAPARGRTSRSASSALATSVSTRRQIGPVKLPAIAPPRGCSAA